MINLYEQRDQAVRRVSTAREARQEAYNGLMAQDELTAIERTFKKNVGLAAVGELPKWNVKKEFQAIQDARQEREIGMILVESLDEIIAESMAKLSGIRATIRANEESFDVFLSAVRGGLDYSSEFAASEQRWGRARARNDAAKSGDSGYSQMMSLRRNVGTLMSIAGELGRQDAAADLEKQAAPVISMFVEQPSS